MPKPILLLAIGNESRGDDALGPFLARRLQTWLESIGMDSQVEIIEEFQLQIEHTLDIKDRQLVLFIDAGQGTPVPFNFHEARAKRMDGHSTHSVAPESLLGLYVTVNEASPPPAFILCLAGVSFELGAPLSAMAALHLDQCFAYCQRLFHQPTLLSWRDKVIVDGS
ncbi:hydrogenase maturation protease [Propionivibrio sp.]|uniref:hydrogenase maturation protease n=1 Tax=Propionivibrio sp. TaxID=2212460 RepID=UPI003BF109BA